jgi:hypothetical protein
MQRYKRNQVEEAISASLHDSGAAFAADLRVRLKRLLETDRALAQTGKKDLSGFYTGQAPGSGSEVWFSRYEAFALFLGLLLLHHRWPQGTAVRILRQARPMLEPEHARILTQDPGTLFDEAELLRQAAPGATVLPSTDPVFLAITSKGRSETDLADLAPHAVIVCRGEYSLMTFRRERASAGLSSMTVLEVTKPAHLLAHRLSQTSPRARGRKSR